MGVPMTPRSLELSWRVCLTQHRHAVQNFLWEGGHLRNGLFCSQEDSLKLSTDGGQGLGVLEEKEQEPEGSRTHVPLQ